LADSIDNYNGSHDMLTGSGEVESNKEYQADRFR